MLKEINIFLLVILLSGCATADYAQFADSGTTAIAFHHGYVESNPVLSGLPIAGIVAVKFGLTQVIKSTPKDFCEPGLFIFTLAGSGAAIWNIALLAGCGPAAFPLIAGLWFWQWDNWRLDAKNDCVRSQEFIEQNFNFNERFTIDGSQ